MLFRVLFAGSLSAALAWLLNRQAMKRAGSRVIIYIIPLVEETAKTTLALLFGAPVTATHLAFGMIEAVFDQLNSRNGFWAGLVSIIGHTGFGFMTYIIFTATGSYVAGIWGGYTLHMVWNLFVMRFIVAGKDGIKQ